MRAFLRWLRRWKASAPADAPQPKTDADILTYIQLLKPRVLFDARQLAEIADSAAKTWSALRVAEIHERANLIKRIELDAAKIAHSRQVERLRAAELRFLDSVAEAAVNGVTLSIGQDQ